MLTKLKNIIFLNVIFPLLFQTRINEIKKSKHSTVYYHPNDESDRSNAILFLRD